MKVINDKKRLLFTLKDKTSGLLTTNPEDFILIDENNIKQTIKSAQNGLNTDDDSNVVELGGSLTKNTNIITNGVGLFITGGENQGIISTSNQPAYAGGFGSIEIGISDAFGFLKSGFKFFRDKMLFISNYGKGIEYGADYSSSYSDRSLVDKGWVDGNFSKYLLKVITPTASVTGTTAETVLYTWFVPANTFASTDRISVDDFACMSNGTVSGTVIIRIRFNNSNVMTTTNNLLSTANFSTSGASDRMLRKERTFNFRSGNIKCVVPTFPLFSDKFSSALTSQPFDVTADNWFFFTTESSVLGNSIYMENLIITK